MDGWMDGWWKLVLFCKLGGCCCGRLECRYSYSTRGRVGRIHVLGKVVEGGDRWRVA